MTNATEPAAPPRLLSREYLPFAIGAVALVTLGAFENRATSTVLPVVARDLDGLAFFGTASAAALITYVVATAIAGVLADRHGPVRVLYAGAGLFAIGQLLSGTAPSMVIFAVGRAVSGIAEAGLDIGLTVLMARALPESLRAKVFSAYAAAWVIPSVVGPAVAGTIADHAGWRFVFLIAIALMVPLLALLQPSIRRTPSTIPDRPWSEQQRSVVLAATGASAALAVLAASGGLMGGTWQPLALAGIGVAVIGLLLLVRRVLPDGTTRGVAGIPAVVGSRGLVAAAFGTAGAFLPLMLITLHDLSPAAAGITLTLTGVCWAAGSMLHGVNAVQDRFAPAVRLRAGFAAITIGLLGPMSLALSDVPLGLGLLGWAVSGLGMGVVSPTLSTQTLALSPASEQGSNQAASQMAASLAISTATGLAGALIALQAPTLTGGLFASIIAMSMLMGAAGFTLAGRAGVSDRDLAELRLERDVRAVV